MKEGMKNIHDEVFSDLIENAENPTFKCMYASTPCFDASIKVSTWGDDGFVLDVAEGLLVEYFQDHKEALPEFIHHFIERIYEDKKSSK